MENNENKLGNSYHDINTGKFSPSSKPVENKTVGNPNNTNVGEKINPIKPSSVEHKLNKMGFSPDENKSKNDLRRKNPYVRTNLNKDASDDEIVDNAMNNLSNYSKWLGMDGIPNHEWGEDAYYEIKQDIDDDERVDRLLDMFHKKIDEKYPNSKVNKPSPDSQKIFDDLLEEIRNEKKAKK